MTEERTPPTGTRTLPLPPRPEAPPTIASVYNLLAGMAGQIGGLRGDVDTLLERQPSKASVSSIPPNSEVLLVPKLPSPDSLSPPSRPSMAVKAAQGTGKAGKWVLLATGALTVVAQAVSMFGRPEYGPIVAMLRVLLTTFGGTP